MGAAAVFAAAGGGGADSAARLIDGICKTDMTMMTQSFLDTITDGP